MGYSRGSFLAKVNRSTNDLVFECLTQARDAFLPLTYSKYHVNLLPTLHGKVPS